jgi:PAS domain S-box-containing protein
MSINHGAHLFDESKTREQLVKELTEIRKRLAAETIVQVREERYRTLFQNNHAVLLLIDLLDGRIIDANSAAGVFYGYAQGEITRMNIMDIDALPAEQVRAELQAMKTMQGRHMFSKHRMADGRVRDVEVFSGPVYLRGQKLLYAIIQDTSECKLAEEALVKEKALLQAILQQMPAGVAIAEASSGKILMVNDQLAQILGTTKTKSPSTSRYGSSYQVFHADGTPYQPSEIPLARSVLNGEIVVDEEMDLQRNDGTRGVISVSAEPVCDSQGNKIACVSLIRDVTEHKKSMQKLKKLNETLEQRVAERTALAESRAKQLQALAVELIEAEERERRRVAQLLHEDLQQILAATRHQVQSLAQDRAPPDPTLAHIEEMLEQSIGMSRRLSHELSPAVLHHSGLAAGLEWLASQMKKQFGLEIQLEAYAMPRFDNASLRAFLFRAAQELLFNIVKHAGVKSARVTIRAENDDLAVSVSDEGKGFDPETIYCSAEKPGFGLLTIKERANYIGGNLFIESSPSKGSRFTLTVPLNLAGADTPNASEILRQSCAPVEQKDAAGKIGVLFADDHKIMRKGLIKLVSGQQDIRVVGEAENGREAIEMTRHIRPDVVVMDISMPEMDGIEATRLIKAEMPQVRVIGLSMHDDEHVTQAMRKAGAEAFLNKTVSSPELLETIYGFKRVHTTEKEIADERNRP